MGIEEFKMIMEAVRAAGEGAYTIAVAYILLSLIKFILGIGLGGMVALAIYKIINRFMDEICFIGKVEYALGEDLIFTSNHNRVISYLTKHRDEYKKEVGL